MSLSYPHHLVRGDTHFKVTEDGFFAIKSQSSDGQMQLNTDDAYDLATWLIEQLKILPKPPSSEDEQR